MQQAEHSHKLLQHIISQDTYIQFIMEDPSEIGSPPFLDTLVSLGPNNTLTTTVYRKPTHTDQYLQWDSNHFWLNIASTTHWHIGQGWSTQINQHSYNDRTNNKNIFMVVPYMSGPSENFKKTCNSLEIQVHFKGCSTICILLVAPKDKDTICQKVG